MADASDLRRAIEEYQNSYRNENLDPFKVSDIYEVSGNWENGYIPFAGECGCYVFYDANGEVCYIGKASMNSTLGRRVSSYFHWGDEVRVRHEWSSPPVSAQVIAVAEPFEAPSLEEFLICRLGPTGNSRKGTLVPSPQS